MRVPPPALLLALGALLAVPAVAAGPADLLAADLPCNTLVVGSGDIVLARVIYGDLSCISITPYTCDVHWYLTEGRAQIFVVECSSGVHVPCVGPASSCNDD